MKNAANIIKNALIPKFYNFLEKSLLKICNIKKKLYLCTRFRTKGRYSSGQRGQTVNLLVLPSQVRILFSPLAIVFKCFKI